jgi:hypothetical protein
MSHDRTALHRLDDVWGAAARGRDAGTLTDPADVLAYTTARECVWWVTDDISHDWRVSVLECGDRDRARLPGLLAAWAAMTPRKGAWLRAYNDRLAADPIGTLTHLRASMCAAELSGRSHAVVRETLPAVHVPRGWA